VANAPTDSITHLKQDRSGAIWVGTAGSGLYRWKDGRFTVYTRAHGMASNWPLAIHEDADGVLWVGSNGEGLTRIAHGTLTAIRPAQGLWDGVVQSIVEDRDGYFWITCNRGFFRVARSELNAVAEGRAERVHSLVFGAGDGLRSNTFASGVQPTAALDGRGHIWLPSFKGLVVVDPRRLPTTGGAPPAVVDEVLDTEWRRAARAAQPLSLVMVDIDAFKAYNDSLGHLEGDRCLAAVADVIRKTSNRAGDFAARYGGEEFVVILPGLDRDAARVFAEALRAACEARALPHPASPAGPVVTISAGVATALPDDAHSPSILVAEADAALYTAKRAGRNRVA
jgi:diguanylate cyclase (GGDEF)-like protein